MYLQAVCPYSLGPFCPNRLSALILMGHFVPSDCLPLFSWAILSLQAVCPKPLGPFCPFRLSALFLLGHFVPSGCLPLFSWAILSQQAVCPYSLGSFCPFRLSALILLGHFVPSGCLPLFSWAIFVPSGCLPLFSWAILSLQAVCPYSLGPFCPDRLSSLNSIFKNITFYSFVRIFFNSGMVIWLVLIIFWLPWPQFQGHSSFYK